MIFDKFIKGTYQAKVRCSNCGREGYAEFIKGTILKEAINVRPCRNCGTPNLSLVEGKQ